LTDIYTRRGLDRALAKKVADQLMAHDALGTHARDELGLSTTLSARPIQAAVTSACSFATGAAMPLAVAMLTPTQYLLVTTVGVSLLCLLGLGGLAAKVGGANVVTGAVRVTFWSALAMAVTASVGSLIGTLG